MKRNRSLSNWTDYSCFEYHNSQVFLKESVPSGVHTFRLREQFLDILVEHRGSAITFVVFHSALGKAITTTPVFQGRDLASKHGVNLVSISDPSVGIDNLALGWHIGNKYVGPLKPVLAPALNHTLESLGTKRAVLFGSSGGGYAAMHYGDVFHKSVVFAVNSRFDLAAAPLNLDPPMSSRTSA